MPPQRHGRESGEGLIHLRHQTAGEIPVILPNSVDDLTEFVPTLLQLRLPLWGEVISPLALAFHAPDQPLIFQQP